MKRTHIIILLLAAVALSLPQSSSAARKPKKPDPVKFDIGIHTGFDIGAAVPWPPGEAIGGGNKMSAVPRLSPMLGLSYTTIFDKHWTMTMESTYKTVAMDAKTWVKSQMITIKDSEGNYSKQNFRGTAEAKMSYTMIEIPLYLKYTFNNANNRIVLGGYYSYVIKGKFETTPFKGTLFNPEQPVEVGKNPATVTPESNITQDFSNDLGNWDAGFILGYERRLSSRVNLSGRFSMGLKDVFKPNVENFDYAMLHMRGTVVLSYMFLRK